MAQTFAMVVDWTGIRRQLRKNGDSHVHVLPTIDGIKGSPPSVIRDVTAAVETANTAMEDAQGQEIVWAAEPITSPAGPIIHIKWPGDDEGQTHEWLDHLAAALTSIGHTGTIKAARYAELPHDLGNNVSAHPPRSSPTPSPIPSPHSPATTGFSPTPQPTRS